MEFEEYWLLETAIESGVPLRLINLSPEDLQLQWNKPPHGMSVKGLSLHLHRLLERGEIVIEIRSVSELESQEEPPPQQFRSMTRAELELAFEHVESSSTWWTHCYRVTEQGGERWASHAKADWSRYRSVFEESSSIAITAATQTRLEEVLTIGTLYWQMDLDEASMSCQILRPWQATYWKVLPAGYRIRCQFRHWSEDGDDSFPPRRFAAMGWDKLRIEQFWKAWREFDRWHLDYRPDATDRVR